MRHVPRQHGGRRARLRRHVGTRVDGGIPSKAGEGLKTGPAIASQPLDAPARREVMAAIEDRNLVAARQRDVHQVPTEKSGSAEDENLHDSFYPFSMDDGHT